jgi:hypothetical protein
MKFRGAAALALVGWYLIAPPPRSSDGVIDPKAPLSYWQIVGRFDTLDECRTYPDRLPEIMRGFYADHPEISESDKRNDDAATKSSLAKSQCLTTDDPRLKGK